MNEEHTQLQTLPLSLSYFMLFCVIPIHVFIILCAAIISSYH